MSSLPTLLSRRTQAEPNTSPAGETPEQVFRRVRDREKELSRLLVFFISGGLVFMLLPGTFLGVWNLISISGARAASRISPAWIQAHGHAQVLGWIGTFILGIGYYSLPKLRRGSQSFGIGSAWLTGAAWMSGVLLRWIANVYLWQWRVLLPVSALLELAAFLVFFRAVSQHSPAESGKAKLEPWVFVVIAGTMGLLGTLLFNLVGCCLTAWRGVTPAFSPAFDERFLMLAAWGFMPPFVWGFSAKWLPTFLGIPQPKARLLGGAVALQLVAVSAAAGGAFPLATALIFTSCLLATIGLNVFASAERPPKTKGVHPTFPYFIRIAYVWLIVAAALGIWAAHATNANGIWGGSRHALTVGFIATMVFCVGQRVLPAFSGMRLLFSPKLMFAGLLLLTLGCMLRVSCEVLAYRNIVPSAWRLLPPSAVLELTAVTLFAFNLWMSFLQRPVAQHTNLNTPVSTINIANRAATN